MAKVLIVYASRTGHTKEIADLIAEGARFEGAQARVVEAKEIAKASELGDCDALVLGSATYHGEMMAAMKTLLFLAEKAGLAGKPGGAFGSFGWSGEANDRIYETMKNIFEMDLVSDPLRLQDAGLGGGMKMAQDYGRQVAGKLAGK